jgi:hypothetical protein
LNVDRTEPEPTKVGSIRALIHMIFWSYHCFFEAI